MTKQKKERQSLKQIPLDILDEPVENVREEITSEGISELQESIKKIGLLEPILAKKNGERYEVIAGYRRYMAAKGLGLATVPCIIKEGSRVDLDMAKLHENIYREDISDVDEARWFFSLQKKYNWNVTEIASHVGRSIGYVTQRLQILNGDPAVLAALEGKQIVFSQAREIVASKSEKVRSLLLRTTIESGASVPSLRLMRRDFEEQTEQSGESVSDNPPQSGHYETPEYLMSCPGCSGKFPVTGMRALMLCNECHQRMTRMLEEDVDNRSDS